jgi:flagellar motor switch protein FliG
MDAVGPVRLSVVEAAQKAILETATALEEEGTIQLRSRTDDSFV